MRVPLYGSCIYVGIGKTEAECVRCLPASLRKHIELPASCWAGCFADLGDGDFAILLRVRDGGVYYTDIFHEVEHATAGLCAYHGIKMDPDNDEAIAYLQGWIGEWVMGEIAKRGLRAK